MGGRNPHHRFTPEQREWVRERVAGRHYAELAEEFNERFGAGVSRKSIMSLCMRRGWSNGMKGRGETNRRNQFKPGFTPWNKGVKGYRGPNGGSFRKGHAPWKQRPVGSLSRNREGFVMIKVADPNVWELCHRVIWEREHGPIPPGMNVIFADGDKNNLDPENLLLASVSERISLDKNGLRHTDAELTKAGLALVRLRFKIADLLKEGGHAKP